MNKIYRVILFLCQYLRACVVAALILALVLGVPLALILVCCCR